MISSESIKSKIRNLANSKNLSSQELLQMFFFERFLERLSKSKYKANFIIKGGLLVASMIGISNRTTSDIDTTVKGIAARKENIRRIILEIINTVIDDGIKFEMVNIRHIREEDKYENFRVNLFSRLDKIKNSLKIDITTGDVVTPKEIEYQYRCIFQKQIISVMAYPFETIFAEKYESIIKRNIATTRMRDFYDLYSLYNLKKNDIDFVVLKQAIISTATKRESLPALREAKDIIVDIKNDKQPKELWTAYLKDNPYIKDLSFTDTIKIVEIIATNIDL